MNLIIIFIIFELKLFTIRIKTANILIFININVKHYYDKYYIFIFFKKDFLVYLRLYKNYNIFVNIVIIYKLKQQYANLFKMLKKIDFFFYILDILKHWRVYSVFIIVILKFAFLKFDFFNRLLSKQFDAIYVKKDIDIHKF